MFLPKCDTYPLARVSRKAGGSVLPSSVGGAYRPPGCVRRVSSTGRPAKPEVVQSGGGITSSSHVEGAADPTRAQLRTLFMHSAVPMVGFGESGKIWYFCSSVETALEKVQLEKTRRNLDSVSFAAEVASICVGCVETML